MSSLFKTTLNTRVLPTGDLRFIRSDCPDHLSAEEIEWLRQNDIITVVDLREEKEYTGKPCSLERTEGFIYHHLPVTGGGDTPKSPEAVAKVYVGMLDTQMDKIIETIMNAGSKVLFFCGAGKDRTGVVSAVLLKKLGFDDQTIIDDYMETKGNLIGFLEGYVKEHPEVDIHTILPSEKNIIAVLEEMKERTWTIQN